MFKGAAEDSHFWPRFLPLEVAAHVISMLMGAENILELGIVPLLQLADDLVGLLVFADIKSY